MLYGNKPENMSVLSICLIVLTILKNNWNHYVIYYTNEKHNYPYIRAEWAEYWPLYSCQI